jgi:hypothetical protein
MSRCHPALAGLVCMADLEWVIRRAGAARPGTGIVNAHVLEPCLVRLRSACGRSTFLMDSDVGVVQYIRPAMSDDDALAT